MDFATILPMDCRYMLSTDHFPILGHTGEKMEHILLECCTNTNHVLGLQLDRSYPRSQTPFEQLSGAVVTGEGGEFIRLHDAAYEIRGI